MVQQSHFCVSIQQRGNTVLQRCLPLMLIAVSVSTVKAWKHGPPPVAQWWRTHLPAQGTRSWRIPQAAGLLSPRATALLSPAPSSPSSCNKSAHCSESRSLQAEEAPLTTAGESLERHARDPCSPTWGTKIRKKRYGDSLSVHPWLKGMWCNTCPMEQLFCPRRSGRLPCHWQQHRWVRKTSCVMSSLVCGVWNCWTWRARGRHSSLSPCGLQPKPGQQEKLLQEPSGCQGWAAAEMLAQEQSSQLRQMSKFQGLVNSVVTVTHRHYVGSGKLLRGAGLYCSRPWRRQQNAHEQLREIKDLLINALTAVEISQYVFL